MQIDLSAPIRQAQLAQLVGLSEARVSQLLADGSLPAGGTGIEWLLAYCARLREQAAGRSSTGPLDLAQERAALAREQRSSYAIKNAVALGEYASISLLADVLSFASQAVVDRLEALPAHLKRAAPDMDELTRRALEQTISSCRNEWVRSTADLTAAKLADLSDPAEPAVDFGGEEA